MQLFTQQQLVEKFQSLLGNQIDTFKSDQLLLTVVNELSHNKTDLELCANYITGLSEIKPVLLSEQATEKQKAQALLLTAKTIFEQYHQGIFEKRVDFNYHNLLHALDFHAQNYLDLILVYFVGYDNTEIKSLEAYSNKLTGFLPKTSLEEITQDPIRHQPVQGICAEVITVDPKKFNIDNLDLSDLNYDKGNLINIPCIKRAKFYQSLVNTHIDNQDIEEIVKSAINSGISSYKSAGFYDVYNSDFVSFESENSLEFLGYEYDSNLIVNDQNIITFISDAIIESSGYQGVSYVTENEILNIYGLDFHPTRQFNWISLLIKSLRTKLDFSYYPIKNLLESIEIGKTPYFQAQKLYDFKPVTKPSIFENWQLKNNLKVVHSWYEHFTTQITSQNLVANKFDNAKDELNSKRKIFNSNKFNVALGKYYYFTNDSFLNLTNETINNLPEQQFLNVQTQDYQKIPAQQLSVSEKIFNLPLEYLHKKSFAWFGEVINDLLEGNHSYANSSWNQNIFEYQPFVNGSSINSIYSNFYNFVFNHFITSLDKLKFINLAETHTDSSKQVKEKTEDQTKNQVKDQNNKFDFCVLGKKDIEFINSNLKQITEQILNSVDPVKVSFLKRDPIALIFYIWLFNQNQSYSQLLLSLGINFLAELNISDSTVNNFVDFNEAQQQDYLNMLIKNLQVTSKIATLNLNKRKHDYQTSLFNLDKNLDQKEVKRVFDNSCNYLNKVTNLGDLLTENSPFLSVCTKQDLKLTRTTYQNLINISGPLSNLPLMYLEGNGSYYGLLPFARTVFENHADQQPLLLNVDSLYSCLVTSNYLRPSECQAVDDLAHKTLYKNFSILDKFYLLNRFNLKVLNDFWSKYLESTRTFFSSNRADCEIVTFYDNNFLPQSVPVSNFYRSYNEFKDLSNILGYFIYNYNFYIAYDLYNPINSFHTTLLSLPQQPESFNKDTLNGFKLTELSATNSTLILNRIQNYGLYNGTSSQFFYTDAYATRNFRINDNSIEFTYSSGGRAAFMEIPFVAHLGDFYKLSADNQKLFSDSVFTLIPAYSQMYHRMGDYCIDPYLFEHALNYQYAQFKQRVLGLFTTK